MEDKNKYDPSLEWEQHIPQQKPLSRFDQFLLFVLRITSRMSAEEMEQVKRDANEGKLMKPKGMKDLGMFGKIIFLFIVFAPIIILVFAIWLVGSFIKIV
ncbi:MAG: hypothetical protein V1848_03775 [Candidatus Magasanikbacteria bacterium]